MSREPCKFIPSPATVNYNADHVRVARDQQEIFGSMFPNASVVVHAVDCTVMTVVVTLLFMATGLLELVLPMAYSLSS